MNNNSRLGKSLLNLFSGFAYRLFIMFTAFAVRSVFIRCLSEDYLGINGLYSNILSMLSLAELGFGTAMVYSMYLPLANRDYKKLAQLMQLYKRAYQIIGSVVLVLGLCVVPFLNAIIRNKPNVDGLTFYYLLFLGDTVLSYWFFAYRNSILQADQKAYVITVYQSIFNLIKSAIQIILLLCFRSYTVYLLTQIACTVIQNIALAIKVKQEYPELSGQSTETLPADEKRRIFQDVKALMLSRISHVVLNSSDTIIISAFVGIRWVGLLSNFNMVVEAITGILCQITSAISASLGNYFAQEDSESGYQLFKHVDFLNFWLYGFSTIALIVLLNPFVTLWIGSDFTIPFAVVVALVLRFLVNGQMNTLSTFRSSLGLFTQGKYRPLIAAGLNIILSIGLSYVCGVTGVLIATAITRCCVNLWYTPWILHRDGFRKSVKPYFVSWLQRLLVLAVLTGLMIIISWLVFRDGVTFGNFAIMVLLVAIIPNAVLVLIYHRCTDFIYVFDLVRKLTCSIIKR